MIIISYPVFVIMREYLKNRHFKKVTSKVFPEKWEKVLEEKVEIYKKIPNEYKENYKKKIMLFLDEKNIEGCKGFEVNEEMKVIIASQACLLTINKNDYYPRLNTILVYPTAYVAEGKNGYNIPEMQVRLGESWSDGTVILAWNGLEHGVYDMTDGKNVAIHEFAHQLDQESGATDGTPILKNAEMYKRWWEIFHREYSKMKKEVEANESTFLDKYAATNEAEFFAVLTEFFFEKSVLLKKIHSELYEEMKEYFEIDPANW